MHDPFHDQLSPYLDGDLDDAERTALEAHLAECTRCSEVLEAMRGLVESAGRLADRDPPPDLWSGIEQRIGSIPSRRRSASLYLAAVLLIGLALGILVREMIGFTNDSSRPTSGSERFLLVLHESPDLPPPADDRTRQDTIERYRQWSTDLARRGFMEAGEKLAAEEGFLLRPNADPKARVDKGGIGGFFILRADDYSHAMRLIEDCPHLALGGWVELRRIETT